MPLSTVTIAVVVLLFASRLVSSNQALAFVYVHGHGDRYHGYYFYHHPYYRHYYHPFYHGHYYYHHYHRREW